MPQYITDDMKISSYSDREDSDEENSSEEVPNEENSDQESLCLQHFE